MEMCLGSGPKKSLEIEADYVVMRRANVKDFTVILPKGIGNDDWEGREIWLVPANKITLKIDLEGAPMIKRITKIGKDSVSRAVFRLPKDSLDDVFIAIVPASD